MGSMQSGFAISSVSRSVPVLRSSEVAGQPPEPVRTRAITRWTRSAVRGVLEVQKGGLVGAVGPHRSHWSHWVSTCPSWWEAGGGPVGQNALPGGISGVPVGWNAFPDGLGGVAAWQNALPRGPGGRPNALPPLPTRNAFHPVSVGFAVGPVGSHSVSGVCRTWYIGTYL